MTATELLAKFADPEAIASLSVADKMTAGLFTTVLGMGITFVALVVLLFVISWMNKLLNKPKPEVTVPTQSTPSAVAANPQATETNEQQVNDEEIVAAITTALAMTMQTSLSNIVIRNIVKVEDSSPAWNRAGLIEQMNSRL